MKMTWLVLAVLWLSSCGANNENSATLNDVGTDLNGRGGSGANVMFWREGDILKRGQCERSDVILRRYCQNNVQELAFLDVRNSLVGGENMARAVALHGDIADIDAQIKIIDSILAEDPGNEDLLSQRSELRTQVSKARQELAVLSEREAAIDAALAKISDERLVYTVKAQGERYADLKPVLQELAKLFDARNQPTQPPALEWTSPSGRTYMVNTTSRSYVAAMQSSCDATKGWRVLTCPEAQRDAAELLTSPLIPATPAIAIANDDSTRAYWTSCGHQHQNVRPALLVSLNHATSKVVFFDIGSPLPVICAK